MPASTQRPISNDGARRGRAGLTGLALALAVGVAGPAVDGARAAETLALHPDVWTAFETYRADRRAGAFAVSEDGRVSGSSQCRETRCDTAEAKRAAQQACRDNGGGACVLFAVGADIKLSYRLLTREELAVCPLSPVPRITVKFVYTFHGIDSAHDLDYLAELMKDEEQQWLGDHGTVMGVTSHSTRFDRGSVRFISVEGRDGRVCAGFSDGEIRLALSASVYIAREIPRESCLYREVLGHEMNHKALGEELTEAFTRDLEAHLAAALADQPYVEVPKGKGFWQAADQHLDALLEGAFRVFDRNMSRRQLGIDSNAEYRRVDDACPGEADKFLP